MKIEFFVFSKKVESWQEAVNAKRKKFYLERPPRSPQKTEFCYDSVRQPNASFHLVDELSNSIIFPVEAVRDKNFCLK